MKGAYRVWLVLAIMVVFEFPVLAGNGPSGEGEQGFPITVRVYDMAHLSQNTLKAAKAEAAKVLRKAGVETAWLDCADAVTGGRGDEGCKQPIGSTGLVMKIVPRTIAPRLSKNPWEFGFAPLPTKPGSFGKLFYLFSHRAEDLSKQNPISTAQMLGCAMAHEIGHLLLGVGSHSRRGIMRAEWDRKTVRQASMGVLTFTRKEVERIRTNLSIRQRQVS